MSAFPLIHVEYNSTIDERQSASRSSGSLFSDKTDSSKIRAMKTHIRERIKAARLHAGYTQEKLGELIGISKSAVSMWETTNEKKYTRPTLENLQTFSKITGAPLTWLLDDEATISTDWKQPAEVFQFPGSEVSSAAMEAAAIIDRLPTEDQLEILHYLRVHARTKGLLV